MCERERERERGLVTHQGIAAEKTDAFLYSSLKEDVSDIASDTVAHDGGQ